MAHARATWLLLVLLLAACAARPGPEVLSPVDGTAGAKRVTLYVATTRAPAPDAPTAFTAERSLVPHYARYVVSIPPGHKAAAIEWPDGRPDPATSFATLEAEALSEQAFYAQVSRDAAKGRGANLKSAEVGIFVHGYNYNFQESLFRLAQMEADSDVGAVAILFAWPSQAALTGYVADKESVTYSRDALAGLMTRLADQPGTDRIGIFAHSMGGWLTMEALRQLRLSGEKATIAKLGRVALAAPDIDVDVFQKQLEVVGPLSPPMTVLVSKDDRALSASRLVAGDQGRIGALDIDDPQVQEAARKAQVQIVDISQLTASDAMAHDRYTALAALYPKLMDGEERSGRELQRAGVFVLDAAAVTLTAPLKLARGALQK